MTTPANSRAHSNHGLRLLSFPRQLSMRLSALPRRITKATARWLERTCFADSARREHDTLALGMLAPLLHHYLPWTGSAMRPGGLRLCLNEVIVNDRRLVIELGTGVSTVILARVLAARGGRLISVDHDSSWQQIVLGECGASAAAVSCIHAPLRPVECEKAMYHWYDADVIVEALGSQRADLLIVDGPIGSAGNMSRYPALPLLRSHLSIDAAVILDDIDRPDEHRIADAWAASCRRPMTFYDISGGVALLQLSDRQRYNIA